MSQEFMPMGLSAHRVFRDTQRRFPVGLSITGKATLNEFRVLTFGWLPL